MRPFHDEIKGLLTPILCDGSSGEEISIEVPPKPGMGDLAIPCFPFSKKQKKSPMAIASEAVKKVQETLAKKPSPLFSKVEANGGYINFHIHPPALAAWLLPNVWKLDKDYGRGAIKEERVMVEYSAPNTHKAFHIGHLRNVAIGSAVVNILRFAGYPTIATNYINDTGTHVAKCLWAYTNFYEGKEPETHKGTWLGEVYTDAVARLEMDEGLKEQVYTVHRKVEANDPAFMAVWEKTRQWSLDEFNEIYAGLGIIFDQWYYDHELYEPGKGIVKELLDRGIAKESEGAIIVDLEPYGLGIGLILKSDGSALYITKDLALAKEKFLQHKIDRSVYVVASEQQLHFKQLFRMLELWGFEQARKCHHLSYELVMLAEGKMSSRAGNVVLYQDLLDAVLKQAHEEVQKRHPEWTDAEIDRAAKEIAIGGLKFGMINQDANKTIIFDIAKSLDFYGETGPYCQYAHARACSVLKKSDTKVGEKVEFDAFKTAEEMELLKLIAAFPDVVSQAAEQYRPLNVSRYCLDLARAFNTFYEQCPIIKTDADTKKARLLLLNSCRVTLKSALGLLGIEAPEQM